METPYDNIETPFDDMLFGDEMWRQCNFFNTLGIQCPEKYFGSFECCINHRCSFMFNKIEQCSKITNCKSKWYCQEHGKQCRCIQKDSNDNQCQNSIYFYNYKNGSRFCEKHKCKFPCCNLRVNNREYHLCNLHFNSIVFCDYIDNNNHKCENIIHQLKNLDDNDMTASTSFVKNSVFFTKTNYCGEHTCHLTNCKNCMRNDKTPWCFKHTIRCDFENKQGERCDNYIFHKYDDDDITIKNLSDCLNKINIEEKENDENIKIEKIHLCAKHKCHWKKSECQKKVDNEVDNTLYCYEHRKENLFYEFEYSTQWKTV